MKNVCTRIMERMLTANLETNICIELALLVFLYVTVGHNQIIHTIVVATLCYRKMLDLDKEPYMWTNIKKAAAVYMLKMAGPM